ncbi:MAG: multidrug effflux MFS transporter [Rhodobacteraceae bacterium]|nr:multidrug effflux MFS transporter [Paracoccaceae bacterium]
MSDTDQRPSRWMDRKTAPHITTLVVVAGITALSMNMFLPSLPGMAIYFDTEFSVVQLAISAYLGVTAVLQLIIGPLSDRYGRRPIILWGLGLFVLATLGCLLAPTIEIFLMFRMMQGTVAVGLVLSRAVVRDMVPPDQAASMIGYVTMGMSLVPMFGPMIGGFLDGAFGWQASFVTLLIFGIIVFAICWMNLGETNQHKSASFGAQFKAYPQLVRSRRFWGYSATAAFASGAFFAFLGGASFVATKVLGLSAQQLGMFFGIVATGYLVGNFFAGRYSQRVGINLMMLGGTSVGTLGALAILIMFYMGLNHPLVFFGPMFFVGLGNGMTLPNANAGIVSVRPQLAGSASGLGGALMIGGGAIISAVTGSLLSEAHPIFPLLIIMFAVSTAAIFTSLYVIYVASNADELGEDQFQ